MTEAILTLSRTRGLLYQVWGHHSCDWREEDKLDKGGNIRLNSLPHEERVYEGPSDETVSCWAIPEVPMRRQIGLGMQIG
jgi:hypothetical protein